MNESLKNPNPLTPPIREVDKLTMEELFSMKLHEIKEFGTNTNKGYSYFEVMRVLTGWIYRTGQAQVFVPETRVVDLIG